MATMYVTQPGDSLWSIAQSFYGDGSLWPVIYEANRALIGDNPEYIQAGWTLTIPDQPAAPVTPPPAQPGQTYVTQPGDSLWSIAEDFYGNGALWPKIYAANKQVIGDDPNAIYAGMTLTIPA
jgi:nucleoid-associated protein YgaU